MKILEIVCKTIGFGMDENLIAEAKIKDGDDVLYVSVSECEGEDAIRVGTDSMVDYFSYEDADRKLDDPVEFFNDIEDAMNETKYHDVLSIVNNLYVSVYEGGDE